MDLSHLFILLNGKPKTTQIHTIEKNGQNGYRIRFNNSEHIYNYSCTKVTCISNPEWVNPLYSKVFIDGALKKNIREIWKFSNGSEYYWRIIYDNGFVQDDTSKRIHVTTSCLQESTIKDVFSYLKEVSTINPLGQSEHSNGTLTDLYADIKFIDPDSAAACYLNPSKYSPKTLSHAELIYPFGSNISQKKAIENAFEHQISIIQGPPGTGKTQTILNIIANIITQGKTVMVVSNNNSATANIKEKLEKYGLDFFIATLGSKSNKDAFIANQPIVPIECASWGMSAYITQNCCQALHATLQQLDNVYSLQNERAKLQQELQALKLEWKHFCINNNIDENQKITNSVSSKQIVSLWLKIQAITHAHSITVTPLLRQLSDVMKWWWLKWKCRNKLHIRTEFDKNKLFSIILELQTIYYINKQKEIKSRISSIDKELSLYNPNALTTKLTDLSMSLFKSHLYNHYCQHTRISFSDNKDFKRLSSELTYQYPVILSTTFSARSCIFTNDIYDYLIIDEASQVSIDTGTLALTCAKNAVIVGDTKQLSNVITEKDQAKLEYIFSKRSIADGYDCAHNNLLQSVRKIITDVPETMLREHYRCHPRIINFCNQKFYGGNLLIMTEDKGECNVMSAIRTTKGNHAINQYNQREIDVIKKELLPILKDKGTLGIVTPYNNQVAALNQQLHSAKAGTIHKYQGREEDTIIMSVVDNKISPFADDANMLNVAVSRAKMKFSLVVTGNEQDKHGNIMDLLDYIAYNNCDVTESKLASIFDYLYEHYTKQRIEFLDKHSKISEYASENLTYALLKDIIDSNERFCCLKILCHVPLRQIIKDTSIMSEEELKYASNFSTHIDFVIINKVSKLPVLAIETDGYTFHNNYTKQHKRDIMKNHILYCYGLPLIRLSTKGSGEREKIINELNQLYN